MIYVDAVLVNNNIEYLQYRFWLQIEFKAGDEVQSGCLERYECCDGSFPNSKGCEDRYTCCESQIDSPGCLKVNKLSVYCIPGPLMYYLFFAKSWNVLNSIND